MEELLRTTKDGRYELYFSGTNYYYMYEVVDGERKCIRYNDPFSYVFSRSLANEMFDCVDKNGFDYFINKSDYRNYFEPAKEIKDGKNLPKSFRKLIKKWTESAAKERDFMWYVKGAEIRFRYKYQRYSLFPWDIDCTSEQFESIAREIEADLKDMGATDINYMGMID